MAADDDIIRPIVVVRVTNTSSGETRDVYAMLDSGSDRDVICESLVTAMNIPTKAKPMTVNTVDSSETRYRHLASFRIGSVDAEYRASIEDAMVSNLKTSASDVPPIRRDTSRWPHLSDLTFLSADDGVKLIIGVSHGVSMFGREIRMGTKAQPIGRSLV